MIMNSFLTLIIHTHTLHKAGAIIRATNIANDGNLEKANWNYLFFPKIIKFSTTARSAAATAIVTM